MVARIELKTSKMEEMRFDMEEVMDDMIVAVLGFGWLFRWLFLVEERLELECDGDIWFKVELWRWRNLILGQTRNVLWMIEKKAGMRQRDKHLWRHAQGASPRLNCKCGSYSAFKNILKRPNLFPANENQPIDWKMAKRKIPKSWAEEIAELDDPAPRGIQIPDLQFTIIRLK